MKQKYLLFFLGILSIINAQSEEISKKMEENLDSLTLGKVDVAAKNEKILELIRLTTLQPEMLEFMIPNMVDHFIADLGKNAKREEVILLVKKRIMSDAFLEPFTALYKELFSYDEIKKLVSVFGSEEVKKFNKIGPKVCSPILTSFNQAVRDVLTTFPNSSEKSSGNDCVINVTKFNYQKEVSESKIPLVLDVYSIFCSPCKAVAPIFSDLSQVFNGKVKFAKLNVDEDLDISKELGVQSIPTFLFIKDGKTEDQHIGIINKEELINKIEKLLL